MNNPSNKRAGAASQRTKPRAAKPAKKPPAKKRAAAEPGHKQRFEQLLDDVVLGVPKKR
jgi:hypothetical protein